MYSIKLVKLSAMYKSLQQALSKFFEKSPQEYMLNPETDYSAFQLGPDPCMKEMLVAVLLQLPQHKGHIQEIKGTMMELFGPRIRQEEKKADSNLQQWEKTILKTLSRHKAIFFHNKAVYYPREENADMVDE